MADYTKFVAFDVLGRDAKDIKTVLTFANKHGIPKEQIYRDIFHAGIREFTKRGFEMLKKGNALDRYADSLPEDVQKYGGWVFP